MILKTIFAGTHHENYMLWTRNRSLDLPTTIAAMIKNGPVYKLTISKNNIGQVDYIPFKFVVNGKTWTEPPVKAKNRLLSGNKKEDASLYVSNNINQ